MNLNLLNALASQCFPENLCDLGEPIVLDGELKIQFLPRDQDAFDLDPASTLRTKPTRYIQETVMVDPGIIRIIVPYSEAMRIVDTNKNYYQKYFSALSNYVLCKVAEKYELDSKLLLVTARRPGPIDNKEYFRELESIAGYELRFFVQPRNSNANKA